MILWFVVQTAKDVEDQTFKESPPTQSIEEDRIVNENAPTQSTKLYLFHQQNQIQEEGNECDLEYRLYKCWDSLSQSCICKLTKLYNSFLHCKKENNRDSVDVGFHGRTTLKLLSSFFCLLSFSQSNVTSWRPG